MGIWVGGIFVKIALFLWCCVVSLGQAFNLQEYRPLIPPLGVLLVILALLSGESLLELNDFLLHSFPLYGLLFEFFLPLFLLLAANIRARLDPAFPKKPSTLLLSMLKFPCRKPWPACVNFPARLDSTTARGYYRVKLQK